MDEDKVRKVYELFCEGIAAEENNPLLKAMATPSSLAASAAVRATLAWVLGEPPEGDFETKYVQLLDQYLAAAEAPEGPA